MPRIALACPALGLLGALAACSAAPLPGAGDAARAPRAPAIDIHLPPAPPEAPLPEGPDEPEPPPRRTCVIAGPGERTDEDGHRSFEIFQSPLAASPALIVRRTASVRVTWSDLPGVRGRRVAKVALGGQKLLRLTGWAPLEGRWFQIRRRAAVHPDQVWIRGGSPVEIVGWEGGRLRVRATTELTAPESLDALTSCDNLVYEPLRLPRPEDEAIPKGTYAITTGERIDLHASPGGPVLVSFQHERGHGWLGLQWLEERDGFVRVAAEHGDLAFHAWAPRPQVEQPHGRGFGARVRGTRCGLRVGYILSTALEDAAVSVGADPGGATVATLETGAKVATGEERGDHVAFWFPDHELGAPEGKHLWVRKSALGK